MYNNEYSSPSYRDNRKRTGRAERQPLAGLGALWRGIEVVKNIKKNKILYTEEQQYWILVLFRTYVETGTHRIWLGLNSSLQLSFSPSFPRHRQRGWGSSLPATIKRCGSGSGEVRRDLLRFTRLETSSLIPSPARWSRPHGCFQTISMWLITTGVLSTTFNSDSTLFHLYAHLVFYLMTLKLIPIIIWPYLFIRKEADVL